VSHRLPASPCLLRCVREDGACRSREQRWGSFDGIDACTARFPDPLHCLLLVIRPFSKLFFSWSSHGCILACFFSFWYPLFSLCATHMPGDSLGKVASEMPKTTP
jgi:hypothetical protein